ncbi:MAG: hypothetical protein OEV57_02770 [Dehalococcoidia bacterium]|nr:hypothetical protein [Dehalococcoidia bacterium]
MTELLSNFTAMSRFAYGVWLNNLIALSNIITISDSGVSVA